MTKRASVNDAIHFNHRSKHSPPGSGAGDKVADPSRYAKLASMTENWRKMLSKHDVTCKFEFDEHSFSSIDHALHYAKVKDILTKEKALKFSLDSGSDLSRDVSLIATVMKLAGITKSKDDEWKREHQDDTLYAIASQKYKSCKPVADVLKATRNAQLWHIAPSQRCFWLEQIRSDLKTEPDQQQKLTCKHRDQTECEQNDVKCKWKASSNKCVKRKHHAEPVIVVPCESLKEKDQCRERKPECKWKAKKNICISKIILTPDCEEVKEEHRCKEIDECKWSKKKQLCSKRPKPFVPVNIPDEPDAKSNKDNKETDKINARNEKRKAIQQVRREVEQEDKRLRNIARIQAKPDKRFRQQINAVKYGGKIQKNAQTDNDAMIASMQQRTVAAFEKRFIEFKAPHELAHKLATELIENAIQYERSLFEQEVTHTDTLINLAIIRLKSILANLKKANPNAKEDHLATRLVDGRLSAYSVARMSAKEMYPSLYAEHDKRRTIHDHRITLSELHNMNNSGNLNLNANETRIIEAWKGTSEEALVHQMSKVRHNSDDIVHQKAKELINGLVRFAIPRARKTQIPFLVILNAKLDLMLHLLGSHVVYGTVTHAEQLLQGTLSPQSIVSLSV